MKNFSEIKRLVDLGKTKGVFAFIKEAVLYVLMGIISVLLLNPDLVYKNFKHAEEEQHIEYVNKRLDADPKIRNIIRENMFELGATRTFIFEFHNGTNNFAGLPFLYADMKYEEVIDGYNHIDDMYTNFNLTRYPFISNVLNNGFWIGYSNNIEKIDYRYAINMVRDNIGYSAYIIIYGLDRVIGMYGITYEVGEINDIPNEATIRAKMTSAVQKLSVLLSI